MTETNMREQYNEYISKFKQNASQEVQDKNEERQSMNWSSLMMVKVFV
jgi:hypothetical protein